MIAIKTNVWAVLNKIQGNINKLSLGGEYYEGMLRETCASILPVVQTRIHEQGKATDGSAIGEYSTKPIYVSAKANPGNAGLFGTPTGKTGKSKFSSGEKKGQLHTSKYFAGGYDEFKTEIGRNQLGSVNLSLSGQLNLQLSIQASSNGFGLGWSNDEMFNRALALENKYGKRIWALSDDEKGLCNKIAGEYIRKHVMA